MGDVNAKVDNGQIEDSVSLRNGESGCLTLWTSTISVEAYPRTDINSDLNLLLGTIKLKLKQTQGTKTE